MASLRTLVTPNRRAAAKLVGQTRRRLQKALADRPDVSRSDIARAIGVHRSVITKQFNGTHDMTLGRAAELAWALGYEAEFTLHDLLAASAGNQPDLDCPAAQVAAPIEVAGAPKIQLLGELWRNPSGGWKMLPVGAAALEKVS